MTIQRWSSRAQHDDTRRARVLPVEEDHKAQAPLKRLGPHHSGIQMQLRFLCPGAEVLDTAQDLEVHLPSICAPGPTSFRVRTGVKNHAVGVAPQGGDGLQITADDFITIVLLRLGTIHAMLGDARWQAMPMRTERLRVEVHPSFFRLGRRGRLARRRLRDGKRHSTPACDIDHSERGNLSPVFGTTGTAVDEMPEPERLLTTLWDEGRVMSRDPC